MKDDLVKGMELIKEYCKNAMCGKCPVHDIENMSCDFFKSDLPAFWKIPETKTAQQIKIEELEQTINAAKKQIEELKEEV